jgi:hypothetical protein
MDFEAGVSLQHVSALNYSTAVATISQDGGSRHVRIIHDVESKIQN